MSKLEMSLLRICLTAVALCVPLACQAGEGIYAFADDQGQVFLSNVPDDKRYEVLIAPALSAVPASEKKTPEAPVNALSRQHYGAVIEHAAGQFGIDAALLHAVISVESSYNTKALSKRGAGGLMQLMPETAKRYGVADVFDPADNVRGGAQYLAELLRLFRNDLQLVLAAYNAGEAAVAKYGNRIPPYRETIAYVPKVVDFYQRYKVSM
jgi:soluble lytic murein transglycosylase-like protein